MAYPVILPRQGQSVESCIITEWFKQVGDKVAEGDLLFSYETDKASFEETAGQEGTLLAVFFQVDDDVPVLTTVAVIGNPGEDISGFEPAGGKRAAAQAAPAAAAAPARSGKSETDRAAVGAATGVSPRARMTAARLGVDQALAGASGPGGRVIERDIFAARQRLPGATPQGGAETAPAAGARQGRLAAADAPDFTETKLSHIRKVIAKTMRESLGAMAQVTNNSSFDATKLLARRARFKAARAEPGLGAITINDLVLFAVSRTLTRHPDLNAHFLGDRIRRFDHVHLGVATDTARGLMVPTLHDADRKSLQEISRDAKALIADAQSGSINPDLLAGGSFTVSNLGVLGIESFTPIVNPPQVAILGVNCVIERVRTVNGQVTAYPAMGLSLTYDHRAVDGAPASRFLRELCAALADIDSLIDGEQRRDDA